MFLLAGRLLKHFPQIRVLHELLQQMYCSLRLQSTCIHVRFFFGCLPVMINGNGLRTQLQKACVWPPRERWKSILYCSTLYCSSFTCTLSHTRNNFAAVWESLFLHSSLSLSVGLVIHGLTSTNGRILHPHVEYIVYP